MKLTEHKITKIIYEIIICILAVISVAFAIMDMTVGLMPWLRIVDWIIYAVFVADYGIRFLLAKSKWDFFRSNLLDLIAIIPISSALRAVRAVKIFRLLKLAKLSKMARVITALTRLLSKCKIFLNTNGFKYMLALSGILIAAGGTLISYLEGMSLPDGIWWAFVTTTTVGYGDIAPESMIGRVVACVLMIVGIGLIGSLTSAITAYFMAEKESSVSNDRVDMVRKLYDTLNDEEKQIFKEIIK